MSAHLTFETCLAFKQTQPLTFECWTRLSSAVSIQRSGGMVDELLAHGASVLGGGLHSFTSQLNLGRFGHTSVWPPV
jgi:hypothetical protein